MAITLSQTTIAAAPTSVQTWRDIKVSIYDEIYLYNIQTNTIDRIIDPDVTGLGTGVESGNLVIESTQGYFPRTPNLSCSSFAIQVDNHCLGDTTHLNFSISLEPDEVLWDFGSGSATTGSASENPTWIVFNAPGNYNLNLNVMLDGVWHDYPITVSIGEKPNVELGENVVLCQGETVNFSVPGEENYEVLWSTGETTPAITVESAGVYSVDVDNVGCIVSDTVEVEMIPMIESNLEDVVLCTDTVEVELNAGNQAANEYNWNTGETSPSIEVENPGQYWVTLSNSCFTVVDSAEVLMIVFPEILLPADTILCAGQNLEVSVNYSEGNISWSTGATGPGIVISQAGNYEVVIDHLGCIAVDEIEADYIQEVSVNLPDYVLCEQEEVDFDVTHPAAEFYLWSTGSTDPEISVSEGGQLWVEVANQCFTDLDTAMVQQIIFPDPLLPGHINACYGDTVQLLSAFSEGIFNWSGGETTNHIQVTESGTYLLTIDYLGCPATAITDVEFQDYFPLNELKVPNVFTPNADDANQHFRPYIPEFPDRWLCNDVWLEAEVTIYNRWGNELHKSICAWDGKSANGQSMHEGTYYYLVDLKANCYNRKESRQIAGYVSLLR